MKDLKKTAALLGAGFGVLTVGVLVGSTTASASDIASTVKSQVRPDYDRGHEGLRHYEWRRDASYHQDFYLYRRDNDRRYNHRFDNRFRVIGYWEFYHRDHYRRYGRYGYRG